MNPTLVFPERCIAGIGPVLSVSQKTFLGTGRRTGNFTPNRIGKSDPDTSIRINQKPVDSTIVNFAVSFFIINIFMVLFGGCFMVLTDNMDYVTAMSSVIATLMNIGPGFGAVGPSENYAFISDTGKWFLSWNMMVGRLEMFSALVIFYPSFWKK